MSRELLADEEPEDLEPLSKQDAHPGSPQILDLGIDEPENQLMREMADTPGNDTDHVRGATLSEKNVPQCVELENLAFKNPSHRCTEEKVMFSPDREVALADNLTVQIPIDRLLRAVLRAVHQRRARLESDGSSNGFIC